MLEKLLLLGFLGVALLVDGAFSAPSPWCQQARITGYSRYEFSPHTYDGTPIFTDEPIVAASWNIPIDSRVDIDGLGTFRVADRGRLGTSGWIDVPVYSRSEAYALTSVRQICVTPP